MTGCTITRVTSETFVCNSIADSWFGPENEAKATDVRIKALEEQIKQLQTILNTQKTSTLTTVQGLPRGKTYTCINVSCSYVIFERI